MTKKRKSEIVKTIMRQQESWLMSVEMDKSRVTELLDEALTKWGDLDDAVSSVLAAISDQHVECARDLGRSMERAAMRILFPGNDNNPATGRTPDDHAQS